MVEPADVRSVLVRLVRGFLLLTGVAVFAVGLLVVFVPELERLLPVETLIQLLGSDYFVVAAVGVVAVAFALVVLVVRAIGGVDEATLPIVESVESAPHPGLALDRSVEGGGDLSPDARRRRLREAAVRTIVRREHRSRSAAQRRIDEGTWTDDDVAAAYLAGEGSDPGALYRTLRSGDDRVRRTVEAIERVGTGQGDDRGESRPTDRRMSPRATDESDGGRAAGADRGRADRRESAREEGRRDRRRGAGAGGQ